MGTQFREKTLIIINHHHRIPIAIGTAFRNLTVSVFYLSKLFKATKKETALDQRILVAITSVDRVFANRISI